MEYWVKYGNVWHVAREMYFDPHPAYTAHCGITQNGKPVLRKKPRGVIVCRECWEAVDKKKGA